MKQIIPIILLLLICIFLLMNIDTYVEGFTSGKCGVGLSCPDQMRCVNGYCKSQNKPKLPYLTGLPLYP
jgi:hypothetical protein